LYGGYITLKQSMQNIHQYQVLIASNQSYTPGAGGMNIPFDPFYDSQYYASAQLFYDPMGFHSSTGSSATFTVPSGGGGYYDIYFMARCNDAGPWMATNLNINGGGQIGSAYFWAQDAAGRMTGVMRWARKLAAGDTIVLTVTTTASTGISNKFLSIKRIA
jgi:hypothetical protein